MQNIAYPLCLTNLLEGYDYGQQNWLISNKLDGIRAFVQPLPGVSKRNIKSSLYARSMKAIPNEQLQIIFSEYHHLLYGMDGEIADDRPWGDDAMARASNIAMSVKELKPNWRFYVFNYFGNGSPEYCAKPFSERMFDAEAKLGELPVSLQEHIVLVMQQPCKSIEQALNFAHLAELEGYEGAVLMTADAPYLQRRVLPRSPFGIKIKSVASAEAKIIGFEPAYYSQGKTVPAELKGKAKAEVGAIHCQCNCYEQFKIGTGFSKAQAEAMWLNQADYIGSIITFEYMLTGSRDRPRQPRFKAFRPLLDIAPSALSELI